MPDKSKRVLIVDDEADLRDFAQAALEDDGYQFAFATNGAEALERAAAERPDLIVMDVQMPTKDGFAALYDIRHDPALKAIPVILLTGIAEKTGVRFNADTVKEYMGEQPDAYFDKPVDPAKLREAARKLLGK
ncbi:MAG TPA: response regulator [Planctomycetota bacterium]|nr:response regulator [Planctomycetota bacterium]